MTTRKTYSEKLRDPRWQKKRLKIMERDGFKCRCCDSATDTLNVHHPAYRTGVAPWDYEDDELVTLCENCHATQRKAVDAFSVLMARSDIENVDAMRDVFSSRFAMALVAIVAMVKENQIGTDFDKADHGDILEGLFREVFESIQQRSWSVGYDYGRKAKR